jgi:hypothetical protein
MNITEAFLQFRQLVNRNNTNNNVSVDKPRFIQMFNDIQNRYLDFLLSNKRGDDSIRRAGIFHNTESLQLISSNESHRNLYKLPSNYFDLSNLEILCTKGGCKKQSFHTFEVKTEDLQELLNDKFSEPSFEYRETFYHISGDSAISIYKKDFTIDSVNLLYYRYPKNVDIEGYIKSDESNSTNINPEWEDRDVSKILMAMSSEFSAINSDQTGYTFAKDRLFQSI